MTMLESRFETNPNHRYTRDACSELAAALAENGRVAEAEPQFRRADSAARTPGEDG